MENKRMKTTFLVKTDSNLPPRRPPEELSDTRVWRGWSQIICQRLYVNNQSLPEARKSFKNREYEHETTLSTYIWQLKDQNIGYSIKWKMLKKSRAYSPTSQKCHLCLDEKLLILKNSKNPALLNKTSELFGKCRHRRKHLLMKA